MIAQERKVYPLSFIMKLAWRMYKEEKARLAEHMKWAIQSFSWHLKTVWMNVKSGAFRQLTRAQADAKIVLLRQEIELLVYLPTGIGGSSLSRRKGELVKQIHSVERMVI